MISNAIRRDWVAVVGVAALVLGIPGGADGGVSGSNAPQSRSKFRRRRTIRARRGETIPRKGRLMGRTVGLERAGGCAAER